MEATLVQHISVNPEICGGKPCIAGTRIRVQDIYIWHELQGESADEIVSQFPHLTLADVYAALAYYWDNPQQIQAQMKAEAEFVETMKASSAGLLARLKTGASALDSISS